MATTTSTTHEQGAVTEPHITPSPAYPPTYEKTYDEKTFEEKASEKDSANMTIDRKDTNSRERDNAFEGTNSRLSSEQEEENTSPIRRYIKKYKIVIHFVLWLLITGWWIAGLILMRDSSLGWLKPFLLWLAITIRLVTFHVSTKFITKPIAFIWTTAIYKPVMKIPEKWRVPLGAAGAIAVIIVGTFASEESPGNTRDNRAVSLFGLLVFIFAFWATSKNRAAIQWQTVIVGMLSQFILALFVLRTQAGYDIFNFVAELAKLLLGFAFAGTSFLAGETQPDGTVVVPANFITNVVPAIIFFVALVQLLYYWGVLQWFIGKFAIIFFYGMKVSGAEAVVAAASPFVGQGESAMLIKPFIPHLTDAELHQIMTSGFATIAGSVLAAYISFGISPTALISSCVMSIPASLAISKLRYPETEDTLTAGKLVIPKDDEERPTNGLHAFSNGAWLGIKIGGMIIAALLCILALLALVNGILGWFGRYLTIESPRLTIELILGYLCVPIAFLLGVERNETQLLLVGKLIGVKVVANEFVAFINLGTPEYEALTDRSRLIATYAVCGFGNISSVGIQIGVLSSLAPGQTGRIARVAFSALISGVVSTLTSASIAGMLIADSTKYANSAPV